MTPTNELRFVEREIESVNLLGAVSVKTIRVLQQKWERSKVTAASLNIDKYEWRDVPIVKEEA